ncbi:MAG: sensor histidine kinase, partial [Marmoricola sp.]|nr:sensor histidine kinase [Marmoricola sp.]
MEANADGLMGMVENLVQFASQRGANAPLPLADIDVAQVARTAVQDLAPVLEPSRVRVPTDVVALARANGV